MAQHNNNWIKLYRSIFDNDLWLSEEPFDRRTAWIDLILLANHKDGHFINSKGVLIKVPRGSHFTSTRVLADRWHWSRGKVDRFLRLLCETQSVTLTVTASGTLISLVNYDDYQGGRATNSTTNEATSDTTNEATDGPQMIPEQEIKEEYKNEKEGEEAPLPEEWGVDEEEEYDWNDETGSSTDISDDRGQLDVPPSPPRSRVQQLRDLLYGLGAIPGGGGAARDQGCDPGAEEDSGGR